MAREIGSPPVSISPLLLEIANLNTASAPIPASEVAAAVALIFEDAISPVQTGCLLYALHSTQLDRRPDILAACAESMRSAAAQTDIEKIRKTVKQRGKPEGKYEGGLVWYALLMRAIVLSTTPYLNARAPRLITPHSVT